jgi:hypothetical protein
MIDMKKKERAVHHTENIFLFLLTVLIWTGCQNVVSIDLNKANPHLVIEGNISDQPGPYTVMLSKTGNYFETALVFPAVSNAWITVTDNLGQRDTLNEVTPGTYQSSRLIGTVGRTYTLDVLSEGREYNAITSMPTKVIIDSFYVKPRREARGEGGYDIYVLFKDPPEAGNYYRLNARSNTLIPADSIDGRRYRLYNDKLTNGNEMAERIRAGRNVQSGDTITVELLSIDKATYDYFHTLRDVLSSDRAATSLSPTNPNTNLSNGSLGYFSAYTIDTKRIVIP